MLNELAAIDVSSEGGKLRPLDQNPRLSDVSFDKKTFAIFDQTFSIFLFSPHPDGFFFCFLIHAALKRSDKSRL